MILHRPGPLQTAKPPCGLIARADLRAVPRSARWRGAPADAPPGRLGGVARRIACGVFVQCRLARGRSAPRRLPRVLRAHPSHDAELWAARGRPSDGVLYGLKFQTETP